MVMAACVVVAVVVEVMVVVVVNQNLLLFLMSIEICNRLVCGSVEFFNRLVGCNRQSDR